MFAKDAAGKRSYALGMVDGKISYQINGVVSDHTGPTAMGTGEWHHLVWVLDGTNVTQYLDGSIENVTTMASMPGGSGTTTYIGRRAYVGFNNNFGKINGVLCDLSKALANVSLKLSIGVRDKSSEVWDCTLVDDSLS